MPAAAIRALTDAIRARSVWTKIPSIERSILRRKRQSVVFCRGSTTATLDPASNHWGYGHELIPTFLQNVGDAEEGVAILPPGPIEDVRLACPV